LKAVLSMVSSIGFSFFLALVIPQRPRVVTI